MYFLGWQEDLEMEPDLDKDDMVKPSSPAGLYGEKLLSSDYILKKKVTLISYSCVFVSIY